MVGSCYDAGRQEGFHVDRIEGVASALSYELAMAMKTARASLFAFQTVLAKLDAGDIGIDEAERLEEQLDQAGRLLSSVTAKHAGLRAYIRKAPIEAHAPNWEAQHGQIFKVVGAVAAD
jgi:hypothetical protein